MHSSANNLIFDVMSLLMSFIYSRNNSGPKIVPCCTPAPLATVKSDSHSPIHAVFDESNKADIHRRVFTLYTIAFKFDKQSFVRHIIEGLSEVKI